MNLVIFLRMAGRAKLPLPQYHILQPHIVQLAVHGFDEAGITILQRCTFVRPPPGSIFDQQTLREHRCILHRAFHEGEPPGDVWAWLESLAATASKIISYDRQHDLSALAALAARIDCNPWIPETPWYCTASSAAAVLQDDWHEGSNFTLRGASEARISLDQCRSHFLPGQSQTKDDVLEQALTTAQLWRCLNGHRNL